jgi:hypothetical protein
VGDPELLTAFVDYDEGKGYRVLAVEDELRDDRRRLTRERSERRVRKACREAKSGNNAVDPDTFRALVGFAYPRGEAVAKQYWRAIREGVLVWGKSVRFVRTAARPQS